MRQSISDRPLAASAQRTHTAAIERGLLASVASIFPWVPARFRQRARSISLAALAFVGAAASCLAQPTNTGEPILIGQSAGLTGGQAGYSKQVKIGIEACLAQVNNNGGVSGRPVKLLSIDDQGKKDLVAANTKRLVETDKVFALIGYTSGAGVEASLKYISDAKVPMLSPATGNMGIRASFNRYLFHTRAGYADEMKRVISYLALTGSRRIGIAYLGDVGPDNPKAMHAALAANGVAAAAEVSLDRNASDFAPEIDTLVKANPQAMLFISNAKPLAAIVNGVRKQGFGGTLVTSSFAGMSVIDELKDQARGLIMIQVLPAYWRTHLRIVDDYQRHLTAFDPDAKPNYTSLEGYISARVLVESLKRAGVNPTRERFVDALESLKKLDLGGYEISFSDKDHNGSHFVDTGVVNASGKLVF